MFYVIQENTFREENYDNLLEAVERLSLPYEIVQSKPFTDEVEFKTDRKDVFVFGSIKLARTGRAYGWNPGSLLNDNHDYNVYSAIWGDMLLNADSQVVKFGDEFDWDPSVTQYFIRPCEDTKTFTGKLYDFYQWQEFKGRHFAEQAKFAELNGGQRSSSLDMDSLIQIATPKKILKEFRFWVVGGQVITGSQYRLGNRTVYDPLVDRDAWEFAQYAVKMFQLADAFVIDIAMIDVELESGWGLGVDPRYKIVEAGCINSAGFYRADLQKLVMALEDFYN